MASVYPFDPSSLARCLNFTCTESLVVTVVRSVRLSKGRRISGIISWAIKVDLLVGALLAESEGWSSASSRWDERRGFLFGGAPAGLLDEDWVRFRATSAADILDAV